MAARNGIVLAGNNEDRNHPETIVSFIPATDKYFGRIVFGYDDAPYQGGMNDKGLFIDGNALAPTGWQPGPGKPTFRGIVIMFVLGTCATCEDVKDFFEKYNVQGLERARFPIADRTGKSMVVEYGKGAVQFVETDTWYQIATNFVMSNVTSRNYPSQRYRNADAVLSDAEELSFGLIRKALNKTCQKGSSLTVYSNIYDLKNGTIYTYLLGNFEDAIFMNLDEELEKGSRKVSLSSLLDIQPEPLIFTVENMQKDFLQLRSILENDHCCLYEYTGKEEFDRIFDEHFKRIDAPMPAEQYFKLTASIVAKVGCMHTALWMPGVFFNTGTDNLFPLQVKLIEEKLVVSGCYKGVPEVPVGSIIQKINGRTASVIFNELRTITSADALNPYFIDSQIEKRFSMFYASVFGFPEKYKVTYVLPGKKSQVTADLNPTDIESVRNVIFANSDHPPLGLEFLEDQSSAIITVKTFSYYDRVDYFRDFMDDAFLKIKNKGIKNLILDLRGND